MTPSTDWKEEVPPGEAEALERLAEQLRALQLKRGAGGKPSRALHAKATSGAEGTFEVLPNLPAHCRVGPFAAPHTYRAYVRFSNGGGVRGPDYKPDVRGIAVKLLGVFGKKVIPGLENATTQDFLAIRSPSTPFQNAEDFIWLVKAAETPALLPLKAIGRFGPLGGIRTLRRLIAGISTPIQSLATCAYYSALPIRFGAHAVHFQLEPQAHDAGPAEGKKDPDFLRAELAGRLAKGAVSWDFRLQFYVDAARTPIEDSSVEWKEADAPFVTVARLTLPTQDLGAPRGKKVLEYIETLSFDPWHALEELRPLGNMMRARNAAYRLSTQARGAAPEPDGSEKFG